MATHGRPEKVIEKILDTKI